MRKSNYLRTLSSSHPYPRFFFPLASSPFHPSELFIQDSHPPFRIPNQSTPSRPVPSYPIPSHIIQSNPIPLTSRSRAPSQKHTHHITPSSPQNNPYCSPSSYDGARAYQAGTSTTPPP